MSDYIEHACPKCGSLIYLGQCEDKKPWPYAGHKPGCRGNCDGECEGAAQKILADLCYNLDTELKKQAAENMKLKGQIGAQNDALMRYHNSQEALEAELSEAKRRSRK